MLLQLPTFAPTSMIVFGNQPARRTFSRKPSAEGMPEMSFSRSLIIPRKLAISAFRSGGAINVQRRRTASLICVLFIGGRVQHDIFTNVRTTTDGARFNLRGKSEPRAPGRKRRRRSSWIATSVRYTNRETIIPRGQAAAKPDAADFQGSLEEACQTRISELLQTILEVEVDETLERPRYERPRGSREAGYRDGHDTERSTSNRTRST